MEINWASLMCVVLAVGSEIWTARQPIVEGIAHGIFDALWGFVSRGLGRLWQLIAAPALLDQGQAVVDLQKIEEEVKTRIKGVEAENEVLREKNGAMEKQVVDLQKIEEELKTKIEEAGVENKVLREKNEALEKKLVQSPVPLSGQYQGSFGGQILSLTFEGKLSIIKSNIGEEGVITLGPWGGSGGGYWAYKLDAAPIMQITLGYGLVIDSILITSKSRNGNVIGCSDRFGGPGGDTATVSL